jgi:hypothetical protein
VTLDLCLLVIGKDQESFKDWSWPTESLSFLQVQYANIKGDSSAAIGNEYLGKTKQTVFGMCHADCSFGPQAILTFYETALQGKVCGIVGRDPGKGNRWCSATKDIPGLVWSLRPGPVSTLDSSSIFFRTDLGLSFDEEVFDGFHCYVEDVCLQAQSQGIQVVVPAANASHRGDSTFDPQWQQDYKKYRSRLQQKWSSSGMKFETT